jgi:beta-glucosidase
VNKTSLRLSALIFLLSFMILGPSARPSAQEGDKPAYLNLGLSFEQRTADLVSRMTLEEKVSQMVNDAPAIDRLGVPAYNWWNECLHGVARSGRATVFPQAIGLAATWDSELMGRVASAISDEARAKHHEFLRRGKRGMYQGLTFWSPNINIFRDPRWGRGMETYGEDPYLTGRMGVAFVTGLQGDDPRYLKTVSTPKHFAVHSGPEPDRHAFDAVVDERDLRETYLPHFEACVRAGAFSVMCAYNRFLGDACCGSPRLLTEILRNEWGFQGYVVSDCGAIQDIFEGHKIVTKVAEAAALGVKSGCDLDCGTEYRSLLDAVQQGLITEKEIDISVKRLFLARFKLGMFDPPDTVCYAQTPLSAVDGPEHRALALEAARKSIVLLKNERRTLPLKKDIGAIAVIGPNADDVEVLLGNYNGTPTDPVTPLRGIREKVSPKTRVLTALGCEWARNMPALEVIPSSALVTTMGGKKIAGLTGEYFDNRDLKGEPALSRVDPTVDFNWWDGAPVEGFDADNFGARWTGSHLPPVSGAYVLGAEGLNGFRLYVNDKLLVEFDGRHESHKIYKAMSLQKGRAYRLKLEFFEVAGEAHIRLLWSRPVVDREQEALAAAAQAKAVIMVMGLSPRLEGEEMDVPVEGFKGGDRLTLDLPDMQESLLKKVAALGKPLVLVLLNGSALAVNWAAENVPAIVEAWYPGQAAGTAIADVLFGDWNPSGRLPVTFYKSVKDLPPFAEYGMAGRTYRYFGGEALYPFGYGLSYSKFYYANLLAPKTLNIGESAELTVEVTNTGKIAGEDVVQLYVRDTAATVPVPIRALKGFQRVALAPGQTKTVRFTVTPEMLSLIDERNRRVVEPGIFDISVGGQQPGQQGTAMALTTEVLTARLEVLGKVMPIK